MPLLSPTNIFKKNNVATDCGAIFAKDVEFILNGPNTTLIIEENVAMSSGAFFLKNSVLNISNGASLIISKNVGQSAGAGFLAMTSTVNVDGEKSLLQCNENKIASDTGLGAGMIADDQTSVLVSNGGQLVLKENVAAASAGMEVRKDSFLSVTGTTSKLIVENNEAFGSDGGAGIVFKMGGTGMIVAPSMFSNNHASSGDGGAILVSQTANDALAHCVPINIFIDVDRNASYKPPYAIDINGVSNKPVVDNIHIAFPDVYFPQIEVKTIPPMSTLNHLKTDPFDDIVGKTIERCFPCGKYIMELKTRELETRLGNEAHLKITLKKSGEMIVDEDLADVAETRASFLINCR